MDTFVVFQKLEGPWHFERSITSHHPKLPSGKVIGEAMFERIEPSLLRYTEHGTFTTETAASFHVHQRYAYRYFKEDDSISKYFVEDQGERLFYSLTFTQDQQDLCATGEHLCKHDLYQASYRFYGGEDFSRFMLTYRVKGPHKTYTSKTTFLRAIETNKNQTKP